MLQCEHWPFATEGAGGLTRHSKHLSLVTWARMIRVLTRLRSGLTYHDEIGKFCRVHILWVCGHRWRRLCHTTWHPSLYSRNHDLQAELSEENLKRWMFELIMRYPQAKGLMADVLWIDRARLMGHGIWGVQPDVTVFLIGKPFTRGHMPDLSSGNQSLALTIAHRRTWCSESLHAYFYR